MKIVTLLGSPRLKGNTATVLAAFEEKLAPRHGFTRINLQEKSLHGCLGCDTCQRHADQPVCAQKDDANAIFQELIQADVLVYATPVYVWDFSAQMKTLLDRQYALFKWRDDRVETSFLQGKRAMLLVTCGGAVENNADIVPLIFERVMLHAGCEVAGVFALGDCTTPQELKPRLNPVVAEMLNCLENR